MEGNKVLELADTYFPFESGMYKKGLKVEETKVLLSFNFPLAQAKKCQENLKKFEKNTGWKVDVNPNCNLSEVELYLRVLLDEQEELIEKSSYFHNKEELKLTLSGKPENQQKIKEKFQEETGIRLIINYPGVEEKIESNNTAEKNQERLDSNTTLMYIQNVFAYNDNSKLYKKSVKSDEQGDYIELAFISPIVGERYQHWISDLEKDTGWSIRISQFSNQNEIIKKAISMLRKKDIILKKNPSIVDKDKVALVKITEAVDQQTWSEIQYKFMELTGFRLEYI